MPVSRFGTCRLSKTLDVPLPDTLTLSYSKQFTVDFTSSTSTASRYFILEGGAYKSEIVGVASSLSLPTTNYFTDGVFTIGSFYRWVEILESELVFVPASFHVGSSWVSFGRNQACVTSNDIGYSTNNDIINTADVHNFEYD
jgi:hypothetical protein